MNAQAQSAAAAAEQFKTQAAAAGMGDAAATMQFAQQQQFAAAQGGAAASAANNVPAGSATIEDVDGDDQIDESGIDAKDIELVVTQAGTLRDVCIHLYTYIYIPMRTYITRTMRSHMSSSPSPRYVCDLTSPRLHVFVCTYVCVCVYRYKPREGCQGPARRERRHCLRHYGAHRLSLASGGHRTRRRRFIISFAVMIIIHAVVDDGNTKKHGDDRRWAHPISCVLPEREMRGREGRCVT